MSKLYKNVVTSISLPPELFQALQKISKERRTSASTLVAEFIQKAVNERDRLLAQQYAEAENDEGRKEVIDDLRKLDDEGWPDE